MDVTQSLSHDENIARLLYKREWLHSSPNTNLIRQRRAYSSIVPTTTLHNINYPPVIIRRFTPDGQYLVTFSKHQHALSLYRYNGPSRRNFQDYHQHPQQKEQRTRSNHHQKLMLPSVIWDDVFTLVYERVLTAGSEQLCKEFCLITANKKHMILSSAVHCVGALDRSREYPHSIRSISSLDDVTFWIVDIETGEVLDRKTYNSDYIFLINHAGVHLFGNNMCIASIVHQSIHILEIKESGKFVQLRTIGWFNYEDDALIISKAHDAETQYQQRIISSKSPTGTIPSYLSNRPPYDFDTTMEWEMEYFYAGPDSVTPMVGQVWQTFELPDPTAQVVPTLPSDRPDGLGPQLHPIPTRNTEILVDDNFILLSGLKQRMLSYLYRRAISAGNEGAIRHFYLMYPYFSSLALWRVQFIDQQHLMIKMGRLEHIAGKYADPTTASSFFIIYSLITTEVIHIFHNASKYLLQALESWDSLRGVPFFDSYQFVSSAANNDYARDVFRRHIFAIKKSRNGGVAQAAKRMISLLPMNPQSFVDTPYFDNGLFIYDDKLTSSIDRTRLLSDFPVKFYSRHTGVRKFTIDPLPVPFGATQNSESDCSAQKRYVHYVFHPTEPLIITSLANPGAPVINLHVRSV